LAFTIPETITSRPGSATPGERKVFVALRDYLPEDYLVYYDIPVKGRYPDFIIVGPDLGLVVLEVKDWRLDAIAAVTRDGVVLRLADGEHVVANPIQQARDYMLKTVDVLKSRPLLADRGNLRCGWGCGAIFPTLKRKDVETPSLFGPSLEQALGPGLVLTGDDLKGDSILSSLRRLIPDWAAARREPLNPLQVDEIRASLFPEIRIGWGHTDDEIFRVMNREQERLALTLGEGHRLLRGVAGSGKTICLIYRARHLRARYPDWRILVVCFNRVLAEYLRDAIGADERLGVLHFHRWCRRELEAAGVRIPAPPATGDRSDYWNREIPQLLLQAYESHQLRSGTYQAIVVDEGQDFADDWYRALLRALDPETNSLFIALDSSQSIYKRKLSWREIGIQIVGHTRVLRVNYRNTRQILSTAYAMIQELDAAGMAARETGDEYVAPDKALRDGPAAEVRQCEAEEASQQHALEWIRERLARGAAPEEILVLGLGRPEMASLETWLGDAGVPVQLLVGRRAQPGAVRLSTIHSAKGLDSEHVLLLGAHQLERRDEAEARRLLYIAMTRARTELCVSYHGSSVLMVQLEELVSRAGQSSS
jgi:hypothetical protein